MWDWIVLPVSHQFQSLESFILIHIIRGSGKRCDVIIFSAHPVEEIHCNCVQTKHWPARCSSLAGSELATADISLSLYWPGTLGTSLRFPSDQRILYFHFRGKIVIHSAPWSEALLFSRDGAKLD